MSIVINIGFRLDAVLGYLAVSKSIEDIVTEFPDLTRELVAACLDSARELAEIWGRRLMALRFLAAPASRTLLFKPYRDAMNEPPVPRQFDN
jgi:hypothetical protein